MKDLACLSLLQFFLKLILTTPSEAVVFTIRGKTQIVYQLQLCKCTRVETWSLDYFWMQNFLRERKWTAKSQFGLNVSGVSSVFQGVVENFSRHLDTCTLKYKHSEHLEIFLAVPNILESCQGACTSLDPPCLLEPIRAEVQVVTISLSP